MPPIDVTGVQMCVSLTKVMLHYVHAYTYTRHRIAQQMIIGFQNSTYEWYILVL